MDRDDETTTTLEIDEKHFAVEYSKTGRAACKKCKEKCNANEVRMAKLVANPWGSGKLNHWFHTECLIDQLSNQRAKTKSIESIDDIDGWYILKDEDKKNVFDKLKSLNGFKSDDDPLKASIDVNSSNNSANTSGANTSTTSGTTDVDNSSFNSNSEDNKFRQFRKICIQISEYSSYLEKTAVLQKYFTKGINGKKFEGNILQWVKLLLPGECKRVYNLQNKQLVKIFSKIFQQDDDEMFRYLENAGDVAETISNFFTESDACKPNKKSTLSLNDVDQWLDKLSTLTKMDEQSHHFREICKLCTANDLQMLIRFIKSDLRINSGPKYILAAVHANAYTAYQSSRSLDDVIRNYSSDNTVNITKNDKTINLKNKGTIQLMAPVSPMLAEACKSLEKAIEKCPNGLYSEVKYDGERVQLHKQGNDFKFFSRNLKPVMDHKVKKFKDIISEAFPNANDLILDAEILCVDTTTGKLLPFGTLGKHKKGELQSCEVCLFIFDCIYYNGMDLTKKTLKERREILEQNIKPIPHNVELSEYSFITNVKELHRMIANVLQEGLEGLVLKCVNGVYEPGKRHWLKVKKDYLFDGQMADTVDLVVLGSWYGSGKKGGMHSIFLMGCYDPQKKIWKTVTKVHTGFDDNELEKLQKPLNRLMERSDADNPPVWLMCKKALIPDMLAKDPFKMPVWEIRGAEFSKSDSHTANGISIRFPRIIKQRTDKTTKESTNILELETLFQNSKDGVNLKRLFDDVLQKDEDDENVDVKDDSSASNKSPNKIQTKLEKFLPKNDVKKRKIVDDLPSIDKKIQKLDNEMENATDHEIKNPHIFDDIILYVPNVLTKDLIEELRYFEAWGGILTKSTLKCTHALHPDKHATESISEIRKQYSPNCIHIQFEWLINSIIKKRLSSTRTFSVTLSK